MSSPDSPETIIAQAQALLDRVQRDLAAGDERFRQQGLDPAKVRATLQSILTPQDRAQAEQAFQADMQDVEQEVREATARRAFAATATSNVRRRRPMV